MKDGRGEEIVEVKEMEGKAKGKCQEKRREAAMEQKHEGELWSQR